MTLLHLTDDELGGVAFLPGLKILSSPFAWLTQLFHPRFQGDIRVNAHGLSEEGATLTRKLIARGVWIDLAHASDASQKKLIPVLAEAGQPLLYSHTALRKYLGAERGISDSQLA